MMNPEYAAYESLRDSKAKALEAQYQSEMFNESYAEAHETLKKLMEYRMIAEDDPRTSVKTKIFKGVDIKNPETWGVFDYRNPNTKGYIPRFMLTDLKEYAITYLTSQEHMTKRVEGNYSGDIVAPERKLKVRISHLNYTRPCEYALEECDKILGKKSKAEPFNTPDERQLVGAGAHAVYQINVESTVITNKKCLGYIIFKFDVSDGYKAIMVLNYDNIVSIWVDVKDAVNALSAGFCGVIKNKEIVKGIHMEYIPPVEFGMNLQKEFRIPKDSN